MSIRSERQKAYDGVMTHLRKQGAKSELNNVVGTLGPICAYRSDNGMKCAIGIYISDKKYSSVVEGKGISVLLEMGSLPNWLIVCGKTFLNDMQAIHDECFSGNDFHTALEANALYFTEQYDLIYTPPTI